MKLPDIGKIVENMDLTEYGIYQWQCYPKSVFTDYSNQFCEVTVNQHVTDGVIYEVTICTNNEQVYPKEKCYRWINPEFKLAVEQESKQRGIDNSLAFDQVKYIDLDVEQDLLEKMTAIVNGSTYDERVMIDLDIDDSLFLHIAKQAHMRDITINQMCEQILREAIKYSERNKEQNETFTD